MLKKEYKIGDKVEIIFDYFNCYYHIHQQQEREYFGIISEIYELHNSPTLYRIASIPKVSFFNFDLKPLE